MTGPSSDYRRERELFEACLEAAPAERGALLRRSCAGDSPLQERVERLLEAHERAGETFLPRAVIAPDFEALRRIGPYRILQVLGQGGMGVVYEAEQVEPIARRVALKVIRLGMDTTEVVARFEAERQALALMDHPNVARVLDAGITDSGRPYFVMELVRGIPLLDYCDRQHLTTRERLELFITLCLAVQHAHQKGIVHRDLKPTNVLVVERDGRPSPKVIDFGVAKAVNHPLTTRPFVTLHGQVVGTPAYMSPEQAESSGLDVDTRTDIYSLGVMLYELLLGALPADPQEVGVHEFLSRLARRETDPPVPSARLGQLLQQRNRIAETRRTSPETLQQELKGDLDWVVMKAMEKDRSRRYESASELAVDLQRHLRDEPVIARPPTRTYRIRKFVRRHRGGVIAAAVAALALALGTAGASLGLLKATIAERTARREALRAREAEGRANQRLRDSLVAQARATRNSGLPGRRHLSLGLLGQAATLKPGSDLRDEAIAAMMLTDLKPASEWSIPADSPLTLLEFDPRLARYAVGTEDGRLEIRSVDDGTVALLSVGGPPARVARFSADSRLLAVKSHGLRASDNPQFRVWDLESKRALLAVDVEVEGRSIDFDPGGRAIAYTTFDRRLMRRELPSGRETLAMRLEAPASMIRFRADGEALAVALGNGKILVLDRRGRVARQIAAGAGPFSIDWSSDGRWLGAAFDDFTGAVWEAESGRRVSTLRGHQAEMVDFMFSPSAPIVATYSWDETSRLWDAVTGKQLLATNLRFRRFSHDGRRASFVTSKTAGLWDVLEGDTLRTLHGHTGKNPVALNLSPDGSRIASAGSDGTLVWDSETGRVVAKLPGRDAKSAIFRPPEGRLITCGAAGSTLWSPGDGDDSQSHLQPVQLSPQPCGGAAVAASGGVEAFIEGRSIRVSSRAGSPGLILDGFRAMSGLELSPGGEWVAAGHWKGDHIQVWDAAGGTVAASLLPGTDAANVRFSPDGRWMATGSSEDYRLWRVGSWEEVLRIERPKRFSHLPGHIGFSRDGRLLALLMDQKNIRVVRTGTGEPVWNLELIEPEAIADISFSPDGRRLVAAASTNRILIWELDRIRGMLNALKIDDGSDSSWPFRKEGPAPSFATAR